jgi:succinate dehydrogenase hydrophobic anchor subunit
LLSPKSARPELNAEFTCWTFGTLLGLRKIPKDLETTMESMDNVEIIRIVAVGIVALLCLVVGILYLLTLSNALKKCSVTSRTMQPGMVWLMLIPLFNIIWHFFVVLGLAQSLGNEFRARNVAYVEPEPGKSLGITMCVCGACGIIPFLGILAALAQLVLWIIYWIKIAEFSRMLDQPPLMSVPPNYAPRV